LSLRHEIKFLGFYCIGELTVIEDVVPDDDENRSFFFSVVLNPGVWDWAGENLDVISVEWNT
jgi:hypothetical protein